MKPETEQTKQPSDGQPTCDTKEGRFRRFLRGIWQHKRLRAFREDFLSDPLTEYMQSTEFEELEPPEELWIVVPPNTRLTKLVILGEWGDNYPEVQLVRSEKLLIAKQFDESNQNTDRNGYLCFVVPGRRA